MFDMGHLRSFVAIAEELHFGRAAARLNISQPPLSRHIQQLERALDAALLIRTSRRVQLTPAGQAFLLEARNILRLAENAVVAVGNIADHGNETVSAGYSPNCGHTIIPRLIAFAASQLPDVKLILKEMLTDDQVDALKERRIDFAFSRGLGYFNEFETVCIEREKLMLAVPPRHALARRTEIKISDLDGQNFIMYANMENRRYHTDVIFNLFDAAGIFPNYVQYTRNVHTMMAFVEAGMGIALVPESARRFAFQGVVLRPIRIFPPVHFEMQMTWNKANRNAASDNFRRAMVHKFMSRTYPAESVPVASGA